MPRKTKIINTIDGVDFDADDYSADVYDLILQSYEIAQQMPGANSITVEVQDLEGGVEVHAFTKDQAAVEIAPEGMELKIVP
jgi:hypothetical protein